VRLKTRQASFDRTLRPQSGHRIIQPFNFEARDRLEIGDRLNQVGGARGKAAEMIEDEQAHEKAALPATRLGKILG
jgi:hypothetical protein